MLRAMNDAPLNSRRGEPNESTALFGERGSEGSWEVFTDGADLRAVITILLPTFNSHLSHRPSHSAALQVCFLVHEGPSPQLPPRRHRHRRRCLQARAPVPPPDHDPGWSRPGPALSLNDLQL